MLLVQNGFSCEYEMNVFMRLFFEQNEDVYVYTNFSHEGNNVNTYCEIIYDGSVYFYDYVYKSCDIADERYRRKVYSAACTRSFCAAASQIRKVSLPWGVMSGVRPAKTVTSMIDSGKSYKDAVRELRGIYGVEQSKCELVAEVSKNEREILAGIKDKSVSLYIGIPFCPSRCLYCSFVSTDIRTSGKYMKDYVSLLCKEIEKTREICSRLAFCVENIYIGGGTPTTLDEGLLTKLLSAINKNFDVSALREFTLEAGRPDTINREKLEIAKQYGVDRVSINPQTTKDETLVKIGRKHTAKMFFDAFRLAEDVGFKVINTDLIAGLPGEGLEDFQKSINDLVSLSPENITVHSMCIKRAAALRFSGNSLTEAEIMNDMLNYAQSVLCGNGYSPYYMYRQKNMSGNLENVGYTKKGFASFYNVNIMEEAQTIIALGGGGSSKLVMGDRIERVFNYKDPLEYIKHFDEILRRKEESAEILGAYYNTI